MKSHLLRAGKHLLLIPALVCLTTVLAAQEGTIAFDADHWDLTDAQVANYLGREALAGNAVLKDVDFENGVIEVDIAIPDVRQRSYPGVQFRVYADGMSEHLYVRPHRAPLYADALQYTPVFNGVSTWQFCNGPGYTNAITIPADEWNHLRIEVHGKQARVYWNDMENPALVITDLKHGPRKGGIHLSRGPGTAPVYFSAFRYRHDDNLDFDALPEPEAPEGMIMNWELSRAYPAGNLNVSEMDYPRFFVIPTAQWENVESEPSGLLNISKVRKRSEDQPDLVFARARFQSDEKQQIRLDFGYSDEVLIFLNGRPVFQGISHYRRRDPSFLGIVGLHDAVYLDVERGRNELFLVLKEWFGGWGFLGRTSRPLAPPVKAHGRLKKLWEVSEGLFTPESVLCDPRRGDLYVTNYNPRFKKDAREDEFQGYISKLSLDGKVVERKWVSPLHAPTGMAIHENRLYTLERRALAEIEIESGKVVNRYPIPDCDFPNDLAIDADGSIYVSDTAPSDREKGRIYRFSKGTFEIWLDGPDAWRPNGMYIHDGRLLFGGAAGDPFVKTADLRTKQIERIASLGAGTIDGLRVDGKGNYLVSQWEGLIYSVTPSGDVSELIDATGQFSTADFEYIPERHLLIVPTFFGNSVIAFELEE